MSAPWPSEPTGAAIGTDGLTDTERALHLAAFQTGVGARSPEVPAAVALLTRAAAEEATAVERAVWTARVNDWIEALERDGGVGLFIAAEARARLLVDDTDALDARVAEAVSVERASWVARLTAFADAKDQEIAAVNATPDPLTERRSTMRAIVFTDELRGLAAEEPTPADRTPPTQRPPAEADALDADL